MLLCALLENAVCWSYVPFRQVQSTCMVLRFVPSWDMPNADHVYASQAGAKHVYGVECSAIADQAKRIVADNGYSDRVTIIKGKVSAWTQVVLLSTFLFSWHTFSSCFLALIMIVPGMLMLIVFSISLAAFPISDIHSLAFWANPACVTEWVND